jgi:glycosyltransferase involved in cell wall biosynthesis
MLTVSLVTLGSPDQLTGGYLYHRRMANLAPDHDARVEFLSVPSWPFPLATAAARRVVRHAERADVMVVDSLAAAFLAPWRLPRPVAAILHQPPGGIDATALKRTVQRWLDHLVYRRCDVLLLASDGLIGSAPGRPCVVVPPGCDIAVPPPGPLPDLRQGRRVAFLSVGNWVRRKGMLDLLEAFARLPGDAATLHLVGRTDQDHQYADRVRSRLGDPDLAARVVVHGPLQPTEIARLYAASDVFVLPSYEEPYGTVYGEALAAGLPVIGWRAGNLPNLADDGCEGVVLEPGDVTGLASALRHLTSDDEYRHRLAAAARVRGSGLPTWDQTASRFFETLKQTVDRAG